jgi:hypothetical protein
MPSLRLAETGFKNKYLLLIQTQEPVMSCRGTTCKNEISIAVGESRTGFAL